MHWTTPLVLGAILLIASLVPTHPAGAVRPSPAVGPIGATVAALEANASAIDAGGTWNCGQGQETFDLFGRATSGSPPYQYRWDFGDGSPTSAAQDPVHAYHNLFSFTANLTVTDALSHSALARVSGTWVVPAICSNPPASDPIGVAVYLGLVAVVAVVAVVLIRRRRQRPLP
ncbi:MAG: PKD domain-containing protein [Thermoplasmata archaeon]|nr:PKD domain-containing protein [Thermoplasmata archaeon]